MLTPSPTSQEIVSFWRDAGPTKWFAKDHAFDTAFKLCFATAHEQAAAGALDAWMANAEGSLALLVLLDQFPRNAFRRTARMFATDGKALEVAQHSVDAGFDHQIDPALRPFFYMPFMHSETLADQRRCVALCRSLDANTRHFADAHLEIIQRFGRFPHRNPALGRNTTAEEQRFLDDGGFAG